MQTNKLAIVNDSDIKNGTTSREKIKPETQKRQLCIKGILLYGQFI